MADDKKIIFSMVGVSKSFQNNKRAGQELSGRSGVLAGLFGWLLGAGTLFGRYQDGERSRNGGRASHGRRIGGI